MKSRFCVSLVLAVSLAAGAFTQTQSEQLKMLEGEWIFLEDRTPGRSLEQLNPPMGSTFTFKIEEDAIILVWGHGGGGHPNVRVKLDGSTTEMKSAETGETTRYTAAWKDGELSYEMAFIRAGSTEPSGRVVKRWFKLTPEGLIVRSNLELTEGVASVGLYRQAKDIPMPTPAKATINDLSWIAGNWSGTRGTTGQIAFEELWSPPKGGSMFAISRTINRDRLSAFEYLRILERNGGLVYIAQPNGGTATEFVMTEFSSTRAVFDNPRHDYPKRIIYELTEGGMTATIGYMKGGTPRKFEFKRESK